MVEGDSRREDGVLPATHAGGVGRSVRELDSGMAVLVLKLRAERIGIDLRYLGVEWRQRAEIRCWVYMV